MVSRVLKIELFSLFLLTVISFFAFYYKSVLPDNYFVISSKSESIGFISYYFTSLVAYVGYFTGPWVFFPFLLFALHYAFLLSRREYVLDTFIIIPLLLGAASLIHVCYPEYLGEGLGQFLKEYFASGYLILISVVMVILFLAGVFRASFKEKVLVLLRFVSRIPLYLKEFSHNIHPQRINRAIKKLREFFPSLLQLRINSILKGREKIVKTETVTVDESESDEIEDSEDAEEKPISQAFEIPQMKKPVQESLAIPAESKVKSKPNVRIANANKNRVVSDNKYFKLVEDMSRKSVSSTQKHPDAKYFGAIISAIEDKLREFGIEGSIVDILKGPVVDTFLLELGKGVRVSKVNNIYQDISVALMGAPIRIVYPMKGRTSVGIEVPRNPREIIYLDSVLASKEYKKANHSLPVAMGKDAFGEVCVVDLADMPHMLVAGATGAGKSVFINTLLVSLLVKKSPNQMQLILIDPKQLELALYANLPHLVMPVVTDAKTASISLLWAVQEMERRYSILKDFGVRNLDGFNAKLENATPQMLEKIQRHYENQVSDDFKLPYVVIVVDEFADLILTKAGKEIENNICRLAGKARAAGIHLVLATQRPSVDVITGLIKSNFPTRVSFKVTTSIDSRTILSAVGAEKLLGKGDMLYKRGVDTNRVHSAYVDENEISAFVEKLTDIEQSFDPNVIDFLENGGESEDDPYAFGSHIAPQNGESSVDSLYDEAVKIVMECRAASASMLQRRLKIGYNRAANLVEEMESRGVVGPAQGSKPRKVLSAGDEA